MKHLISFLKRWGLVVSMLTGASTYWIYSHIESLNHTHALANQFVQIAQPTLLFSMLLVTFLKVKPSDFKLHKWQIGGLALQGGFWIVGTLLLMTIPMSHTCNVAMQGFLLCMICPTATAAAVITGKLGGNQVSLTLYLILANLLASFLIPAMLPMVFQHEGLQFWPTFARIVMKIFPLLFLPLLCANLMRKFCPRLTAFLTGIPNAAFYLWMIALSLAIAVSVKTMHHSLLAGHGLLPQLAIAASSLIACIVQFSFGRWMGKHLSSYPKEEVVSATQGLGQKNTIFSIWCGYTFMDPLSSIAGGFYSIWHNIYNSYQLDKLRKEHEETRH